MENMPLRNPDYDNKFGPDDTTSRGKDPLPPTTNEEFEEFEEIIVEEEDEEYIEEIIEYAEYDIDDNSQGEEQGETNYSIEQQQVEFQQEEDFTEVTVESDDDNYIATVTSIARPATVPSGQVGQGPIMRDGSDRLNSTIRSAQNNDLKDGSIHSNTSYISSQSGTKPSTGGRKCSIKTAAQKQAEIDAARKLKEAQETREIRELILEKQRELEDLREMQRKERAEEEAELARIRAEREALRIEKEKLEAEIAAAENKRRIGLRREDSRKRMEVEESQRRLEEDGRRKAAAIKAAAAKEAAERASRDAEEFARREEELERQKLQEEVQRLEAEMEQARREAEIAKQKEEEEKKRLQAKIKAKRQAAKERLAQAQSAVQNNEDQVPSMFEHAVRNSPSPRVQPKAGVKLKPAPAPNLDTLEASTAPSAPIAKLRRVADEPSTFYSVDQLRTKSVAGLDYKNREKYISPEDFEGLFQMSREEFSDLPQWKKTQLKRKQGLF